MTDNKYLRGKIYKLVNDVDDEIYIGSTTQPLYKRFHGHKVFAKKEQNRRVLQHLNKIGWENVKIILIEECPCKNKMELLKKEREHIDILKPALNKQLPTRTFEEWYEQNKVTLKEKQKEYYNNHKEKLIQKQKKHYEQNKEHILKRRKEYGANNKEKIDEYKKRYIENNKDAIREKRSQMVKCTHCNDEVTRSNISRHIKAKHQA